MLAMVIPNVAAVDDGITFWLIPSIHSVRLFISFVRSVGWSVRTSVRPSSTIIVVAVQEASEPYQVKAMETIFIKEVHPNGPAYYANLQTGDRVLMVNNTPIAGIAYSTIVSMIKQTPSELKLLVVPKECDVLQMVSVFFFLFHRYLPWQAVSAKALLANNAHLAWLTNTAHHKVRAVCVCVLRACALHLLHQTNHGSQLRCIFIFGYEKRSLSVFINSLDCQSSGLERAGCNFAVKKMLNEMIESYKNEINVFYLVFSCFFFVFEKLNCGTSSSSSPSSSFKNTLDLQHYTSIAHTPQSNVSVTGNGNNPAAVAGSSVTNNSTSSQGALLPMSVAMAGRPFPLHHHQQQHQLISFPASSQQASRSGSISSTNSLRPLASSAAAAAAAADYMELSSSSHQMSSSMTTTTYLHQHQQQHMGNFLHHSSDSGSYLR